MHSRQPRVINERVLFKYKPHKHGMVFELRVRAFKEQAKGTLQAPCSQLALGRLGGCALMGSPRLQLGRWKADVTHGSPEQNLSCIASRKKTLSTSSSHELLRFGFPISAQQERVNAQISSLGKGECVLHELMLCRARFPGSKSFVAGWMNRPFVSESALHWLAWSETGPMLHPQSPRSKGC